MAWILDRLGESSTWRGIIGIATAVGVGISPELATGIIAAGTGTIGLINVLRTERKR